MGARVAAEVCTTSTLTGDFILGVACLCYPLHRPKKFTELRISHLIHLGVPVLIINGTEDSMCRMDLMDNVIEQMGSDVKIHWVHKCDHSLHIKGKMDKEIIDRVCQWTLHWCQSVFMGERS